MRPAARELGTIDVLVNNASVIQVGPVSDHAVEDFEAAMATNFWGRV
jgi:NAD(P)-dependent dehydrogenase (short-subunit alcohol dehydrogenase family)